MLLKTKRGRNYFYFCLEKGGLEHREQMPAAYTCPPTQWALETPYTEPSSPGLQMSPHEKNLKIYWITAEEMIFLES